MRTGRALAEDDDRRDLEASFRSLVTRVRPRAAVLLSRYRIPPQDGEDLLQQALLVLFTKHREVRCPEAWVLGTLRNQCLRYWRRRRRRPWDPIDDDLLERLGEPKPSGQELGDLRRDLSTALARLPERHRTVVRLRFGLGLKPEEIASRTAYRPTSIRKILSRCLEALGRELATAEGGAGRGG